MALRPLGVIWCRVVSVLILDGASSASKSLHGHALGDG